MEELGCTFPAKFKFLYYFINFYQIVRFGVPSLTRSLHIRRRLRGRLLCPNPILCTLRTHYHIIFAHNIHAKWPDVCTESIYHRSNASCGDAFEDGTLLIHTVIF